MIAGVSVTVVVSAIDRFAFLGPTWGSFTLPGKAGRHFAVFGQTRRQMVAIVMVMRTMSLLVLFVMALPMPFVFIVLFIFVFLLFPFSMFWFGKGRVGADCQRDHQTQHR